MQLQGEQVPCAKHLGVVNDEHLQWSCIKMIVNKANSRSVEGFLQRSIGLLCNFITLMLKLHNKYSGNICK